METRRHKLRDALAVAFAALMIGGCAPGAPGTAPDPAAKQEANREKQKDLAKMLEEGMEMR